MAIFDSFASRLARPAGRMLDAPIRDIVHELLKEHGYASPAEVQGLRDELAGLRGRVDGLDRKVGELAVIAEEARAAAAAARTEAAQPATAAADPRVAELEDKIAGLETALEKAAEQARMHTHGLPSHSHAPDPRVAELEAEVAALVARLAKLDRPAAAAAPAPAAQLSAAPRGACKVPDCEEAVRSKGFCSAHYQQWRRGTLKTFVSADGTALVDGRVVHFPSSAVGGHVTSRDGRFYVDGNAMSEIAAG